MAASVFLQEMASFYIIKRTMGSRIYINKNWKYISLFTEDMISNDMSGYMAVSLPHTPRSLPLHYYDAAILEFSGCYQKSFVAPYQWKEGEIFLNFQGIGGIYEIYLNGQLLASGADRTHTLKIDVTKALNYGEENLITVHIENAQTKDAPKFGGLIREVYFSVYHLAHFMDCVYFPNVLENITTFRMNPAQISQMQVQCMLKSNCYVSGEVMLLSMDNKIYIRQYIDDKLLFYYPISGIVEDEIGMVLKTTSAPVNLRLWDVLSPTVYTVRTQLLVDDEVLDEHSEKVCFFRKQWTENAFLLNGRRLLPKGVIRDSRFAYLGPAVSESIERYDAYNLKEELDINFVAPLDGNVSEYFTSECQRLGIMVFDEEDMQMLKKVFAEDSYTGKIAAKSMSDYYDVKACEDGISRSGLLDMFRNKKQDTDALLTKENTDKNSDQDILKIFTDAAKKQLDKLKKASDKSKEADRQEAVHRSRLVSRPKLQLELSHNLLTENHTYDMAAVKIRITDSEGQILSYYNDPITVTVTGNIELIGPPMFSAYNGMAGFYIRSTGVVGEGHIVVSAMDAAAVEAAVSVEKLMEYQE